jgi:hypothetical protein
MAGSADYSKVIDSFTLSRPRRDHHDRRDDIAAD